MFFYQNRNSNGNIYLTDYHKIVSQKKQINFTFKVFMGYDTNL